jgi:putative acyl-CoA dehydrogenase
MSSGHHGRDAPHLIPAFADIDLLMTDAALRDALRREGSVDVTDRSPLADFARQCGSADRFELGRQANAWPPVLRAFVADGRRRDFIEHHPAYHELIRTGVAAGLASGSWMKMSASAPATGSTANVERAARLYLAAQADAGHVVPLAMTNASASALLRSADLAEAWLPRILSPDYDPRSIPAPAKRGATIGIATTERQGDTWGKDVATSAVPAAAPSTGEFLLNGHKSFVAAPMSDAFLVLARTPGGVSCLLLPRLLPDGRLNGVAIRRLRETLGNRSTAVAEIELDRAHAWLVGEEGHGTAVLADADALLRLDAAVMAAGQMRLTLATALHHARHRRAGGRLVIEQPAVTEVFADIALDVEASTALTFRLARAVDQRDRPAEAAFAHLMMPVTKYWVCKIAPAVAAEAMECLGGSGCCEEGLAARVYRDVPATALWLGPGNLMVLDVVRMLQHEPEVVALVLEHLGEIAARDPHLGAGMARIEAILQDPRAIDRRARQLVETLAIVAAGVVLRRHGPQPLADAFIASRLSGLPRMTYGQGIDWVDARAIVDRAFPAV